jgi:DNA-binding transcriptional regulator YhcF (GntR family)
MPSTVATERNSPAPAAQLKLLERRWTAVLVKAGWTALPSIVLEKQAALGLKPIDVNILMQIAKHWWGTESAPPFPSIDSIAATIGVAARTVQRHISAMEKAKLIERNPRYYALGGQKSNAYTFKGLIEQCQPFAEEALTERTRHTANNRARIRRKKPLKLVK